MLPIIATQVHAECQGCRENTSHPLEIAFSCSLASLATLASLASLASLAPLPRFGSCSRSAVTSSIPRRHRTHPPTMYLLVPKSVEPASFRPSIVNTQYHLSLYSAPSGSTRQYERRAWQWAPLVTSRRVPVFSYLSLSLSLTSDYRSENGHGGPIYRRTVCSSMFRCRAAC